MKSERDSKIAVLLNIPMTLLYGGMLTLTGLMLYAYSSVHDCDPLAAGYITNGNQMVPYFVMHVFNNVPGVAGLFIAALFSGALSSLSSGINSMAANTLQDILINCLKEKSQITKTLIAKLFVFVYGILTVVLAYSAKHLSGPITQIALTAMGACGGPIVGIMFLGAAFPQANWIGALSGGLLGIGINIWVAVCSVLYGNKAPQLPPVSTDGCIPDFTWVENVTVATGAGRYTTEMPTTTNTSLAFLSSVSAPNDYHFPLYDMSYLYFGLMGFVVAFLVGIIISLVTSMDRGMPTEPEYIFPCLRHFWKCGYAAVASPDVYTVTRMKHRKGMDQDLVIPQIASIKSLELSWYNKQSEDLL